MTDQLIPPVISPSPARPAARPGVRAEAVPCRWPTRLACPRDAVYGMSRVDASGRVAGQVISRRPKLAAR